jgi:pimeloyl-ACP methyl ester carboxylesterase
VAVVGLAVLLVSACSGDDSAAPVVTGSVPESALPGAQPAATLTDEPCNGSPDLPPTKCYFLEVPESRHSGDTKTIKLFVAVITPPGSAPNALPLVWLAGGPGEPASGVLDNPPTFVGTPRPVVFVDQRGTGRSDPRLDCEARDQLVTNGTQAWADRVAAADAAVKVCRQQLVAAGVDLSAFNTAENAADIVDLRTALGYDKWFVYGVSYGGRLAQQVLEIDGPSTAGVILDSSIPSSPFGPASLVDLAKDAVARLSAACAAEPRCHANTPDLVATYDAAVKVMNATPYTTGTAPDGSPSIVTGEEVISGAFQAQYNPDLIPLLPGAAKSIADGQTDVIDALARQIYPDDDLAQGMYGTSLCADDGASMTSADHAVLADPGDYGSFVLGWAFTACDVWDVPPVPGGPLKEPVSDVPVLLMEGGLDPVAPPRNADLIKKGLTHATVVVFPAGGHGNAFRNDCGLSIVEEFLNDPAAQPDTSCVASLPPPFAA